VVTIEAHHARGPEETVFDMPPMVSARTREWETASTPAPSPIAKPRDGKKHKPVGGAGILITPSFTAWTDANRNRTGS
jgi:hypothetical protein